MLPHLFCVYEQRCISSNEPDLLTYLHFSLISRHWIALTFPPPPAHFSLWQTRFGAPSLPKSARTYKAIFIIACIELTWHSFVITGTGGIASARSHQKLLPCWIETVPDSCKRESLLANNSCASVITYLRNTKRKKKKRKNHNSSCERGLRKLEKQPCRHQGLGRNRGTMERNTIQKLSPYSPWALYGTDLYVQLQPNWEQSTPEGQTSPCWSSSWSRVFCWKEPHCNSSWRTCIQQGVSPTTGAEEQCEETGMA